jgi:hypothetical protein
MYVDSGQQECEEQQSKTAEILFFHHLTTT